MYQKGEIVINNEQEYIILDINFKTKMVEIGIPDADNITRNRRWVSITEVTEQQKQA